MCLESMIVRLVTMPSTPRLFCGSNIYLNAYMNAKGGQEWWQLACGFG